MRYGQPDYAAWGRLVARRVLELSVIELHWLLVDNPAFFREYERRHPGAGLALQERVMTRVSELEATAP